MLARLNQGHLGELLKGGAISLVLKLAAALLAFVMSIAAARLLGAEVAGYYFLAVSIVSVLAMMARVGLDQVVTREVVAGLEEGNVPKIRGLYRQAFWLVALVSTIFSLCVVGLSDWLAQDIFDKPPLATVLSYMGWAVIPFALAMLHGQFFQGLKHMPLMQLSQGLGLSLLMLAAIGGSLLGTHLWSASQFGLLYLLCWLLVMFFLAGSWQRMQGWAPRQSFPLGPLLLSAMPFWGVMSLNMVLQWGGPILLGYWVESDQVAIFLAALRTAMLVTIVLMAVNSIAAPKFAAQYHRGDMQGLQQVAVWSTRLMLLLCTPAVAFLLLFPEWVMGLFGAEFTAGSQVLVILVLGQLVNVATGSVGWLLSMTGHGTDLLKSTGLAALLMLALCAWLIPLYGMQGAAWAQTAALSLQMLTNTCFVKYRLGFVPMNIFAKINH